MKEMMCCSNCAHNKAQVKIDNYRFEECGLDYVVLKGIEIVECPKCGNIDPIIPRPVEIMRILAQGVISKKSRLSGKEVRFLRNYLQMTGAQFARFLHTDKNTLAKQETGKTKIGPKTDLLIRLLALQLGEGLQADAHSAVLRFPDISERKDTGRQLLEVVPETQQCVYV
jgi:YgiT-type zinc finger domain-containing protein